MRLLLSVIIATRNRRALLAQTLEALVRQRRPKGGFEIVVADNGSTDGTRTAVMRAADRSDAPAIRYLFVAKPGKSHAVNAALDVARGDIIAFTDDDVRPDPDWLDAIVEALDHTGADFVAGRIRPVWETAPPPWMSPELYGVLAVPDNGPTRIEIA